MIAALFVATGGCYFDLPDVDPWDVQRDARTYAGPHPVVAHPPCERWGRYWNGGPSARVRRTLGDDGGCFAAALAAVRTWGGVLEHPHASHAWAAHGLTRPPWLGGWVPADYFGGWTCCVQQAAYGHRARKATWLYAVGCDRREMIWHAPPGAYTRLDHGYHTHEERVLRVRMRGDSGVTERLSKSERSATPIGFRDLLLDLAHSAMLTMA